MITIDYDKCVGCMTCVSVCPFTVLMTEDGLPRQNPEKKCLKCMHCAAACPKNAVMWDGQSAALDTLLTDMPGDFAESLSAHIQRRRSYRHFEDRPVDAARLACALDIAAFAPSAKNQHPTKWIVVNGKERIEEIMNHILDYVKETQTSPEILSEYERGNNVVTGTASTLIMGYAPIAAINPPVDTALALYSAELLLQADGIGTCWAGYLTRMSNDVPALKTFFSLPEDCRFYGALMAGYAKAETYLRLPVRLKTPDIVWL